MIMSVAQWGASAYLVGWALTTLGLWITARRCPGDRPSVQELAFAAIVWPVILVLLIYYLWQRKM